jgi:hypothetical protein
MASLAVVCLGSVHHPLGVTALTVGDLDAAVTHFEAAIVAALRFGNRPCHAIATAELAGALGRRRGPGDVARAARLWTAAIDDADRLGLTARAAEWRAAGRRADDRAAGDLCRSCVVPSECRRDGDVWTINLDGRTVAVPHSVGMDYLRELMANEGVEIPAVDLVSGHAVGGRSGGPQVVLDDAAKAAYRRRVEDLRAEIDDADDCNDLERAARAREELDVLLDELRRAVGLGGRARRFGDDAERARVSVRKAIIRALNAVRAADPAVGAALAERIVTGTRCLFTAPSSTAAVA